jgi:hypothetical protein
MIGTIMILSLLIVIVWMRRILREEDASEGFADSKMDPTERPDPAKISAAILRPALQQIRKVTRHFLNPIALKERLQMAKMSPRELAQKYMKETK